MCHLDDIRLFLTCAYFFCRFTCTNAYKNLLNELGDQAGQHEMIAENLSTSVVLELSKLVKELKDDRRKVRKQNLVKKRIKFHILFLSIYKLLSHHVLKINT